MRRRGIWLLPTMVVLGAATAGLAGAIGFFDEQLAVMRARAQIAPAAPKRGLSMAA